MSALDPYYIVKDEVEDLVAETEADLRQWEQLPEVSSERAALTKKLFSTCDTIKWQLDELDKAIGAAERDPKRFSMNFPEVQRRKAWTSVTRTQVSNLRKTVQVSDDALRIPNVAPMMPLKAQFHGAGPPPKNQYHEENEEYIRGEQDRQSQLIKDQDQNLDELSESVDRIGEVGLAIHTELGSQESLLGDLGRDIETTSSRLDYATSLLQAIMGMIRVNAARSTGMPSKQTPSQECNGSTGKLGVKKMELLMKKAGAKGQIVLIAFLVILLAILILLTFYT